MERNIKQKINNFSMKFKQDIQLWLQNKKIIDDTENDCIQEFIQYIFDYETIILDSEDFKKRKRIKNQIPNYDRCCALRCNHERCTRKKKKNSDYCGTHNKGIPYGSVGNDILCQPIKKISIWLEEINGIHQYIDINHNVYSTEDMNEGINPPRVISNWMKDSFGKYQIKN
jgi:hypothetical protein